MSRSDAVVWRRWWKRSFRTSPTGKSLNWQTDRGGHDGVGQQLARGFLGLCPHPAELSRVYLRWKPKQHSMGFLGEPGDSG
jgi:hypothetical protein